MSYRIEQPYVVISTNGGGDQLAYQFYSLAPKNHYYRG